MMNATMFGVHFTFCTEWGKFNVKDKIEWEKVNQKNYEKQTSLLNFLAINNCCWVPFVALDDSMAKFMVFSGELQKDIANHLRSAHTPNIYIIELNRIWSDEKWKAPKTLPKWSNIICMEIWFSPPKFVTNIEAAGAIFILIWRRCIVWFAENCLCVCFSHRRFIRQWTLFWLLNQLIGKCTHCCALTFSSAIKLFPSNFFALIQYLNEKSFFGEITQVVRDPWMAAAAKNPTLQIMKVRFINIQFETCCEWMNIFRSKNGRKSENDKADARYCCATFSDFFANWRSCFY